MLERRLKLTWRERFGQVDAQHALKRPMASLSASLQDARLRARGRVWLQILGEDWENADAERIRALGIVCFPHEELPYEVVMARSYFTQLEALTASEQTGASDG